MSRIWFESRLPSSRRVVTSAPARPIIMRTYVRHVKSVHGGDAAAVIAESRTYSDALRRLGLRPAGGNHAAIKKYAARWGISTAHFDHDTARVDHLRRPRKPLREILVDGSTYHRGHLKRRLLAEGLKQPRCELCGQDETWRGRPMALILDHINGVPNDNRLENLRIVCPNCAATFDTHCGRKNRLERVQRKCLRCGGEFIPAARSQRYCSR